MTSGPLRVLYVHHAEMVGGAAASLLCLLRHLPDEAVQATLLSPDGGMLSEDAAAGAAHLQHVAPWNTSWTPSPLSLVRQFRALNDLAQTVRGMAADGQFDVIHANTWPAAVAASVSGVRTPIVWHVRDLLIRPLISRRLRTRTAAQIAISRTVADFLTGRGYERERVRLVYNGIDPAEFQPDESREQVRAELQTPAECPLICSLARPVPWKRHDLLLEAAAIVHEQEPGARFVFAGAWGDEEADAFAQLAVIRQELGLDDAVSFLPYVDRPANLLNASDVFLHAASTEPLGRVILEAMVLGKAIVVPNAAGPGELIDDGVSGLAVEPNDPRALADGVLRMLSEPDFAASCGRHARERAVGQFSAERMVCETIEVYRSVLGRLSQ